MNARAKKSSPQKIGSIVEQVLANSGLLAVCREQDILRRWGELVGDRIAAVTECTRTERGVLYVHVRSAPWRNELVYLKPMLLARVRAECSTIRDIIFS